MYLIELVTERYASSSVTKIQLGYKKSELEAKEYCIRKNEEIEGSYNDSMGCKYYQFRKMVLLDD